VPMEEEGEGALPPSSLLGLLSDPFGGDACGLTNTGPDSGVRLDSRRASFEAAICSRSMAIILRRSVCGIASNSRTPRAASFSTRPVMMCEPGHHPLAVADIWLSGLWIGEKGQVLSGIEESFAEFAPPMNGPSAMAEGGLDCGVLICKFRPRSCWVCSRNAATIRAGNLLGSLAAEGIWEDALPFWALAA